jgi:hypothetical protein
MIFLAWFSALRGVDQTDIRQPSRECSGHNSRPQLCADLPGALYRQPSSSAYLTAASTAALGCLGLGMIFLLVDVCQQFGYAKLSTLPQ